MSRNSVPVCLCLLAPFCFSATSCCSVTPPHEINEKYREVLNQRHDQYRIKDGDILSIGVQGLEGELSEPALRVLADGRSDASFLDNHRFGGKSIPEIEAELLEAMGKRLKQKQVEGARISIQVAPSEEVVYLVGEYERPATVTLRTKMTLHEAISAVRGMRITGDTDYALLRRPYGNPLHPELFRIDLNDESEEIFLLPGDQIVLERNFFATIVAYLREFVFGIVGYPQSYLYSGLLAGAAF